MSRLGRVRAQFRADWRSFLRRRTAVFFTFVFPLLIVVIFGVLVEAEAGGGGLFTEPPSWYAAGYLAVVVLFTPLSRVGSEVARHREGNRFEKLATTPLTRVEWLLAGTLVNTAVIGLAGLGLLGLMVLVTGADVAVTAIGALALVAYVVLGVAVFCGVGAAIGALADTQDGVIAASNALALPLLFLSETFVQRALLPDWLPLWVSPLTYFARGVRAITHGGTGGRVPVAGVDPVAFNLVLLAALAAVVLAVGAGLLPRTD